MDAARSTSTRVANQAPGAIFACDHYLQSPCSSHSGKPHCGKGQYLCRPAFLLHANDKYVGIRYHASHAGTESLQNFPSQAVAIVNDLIRDKRDRDRGDVRHKNDKSFDSRAAHFARFCLKIGFTDKSIAAVTPGQAIPLLAAYLFKLASGEESLMLE